MIYDGCNKCQMSAKSPFPRYTHEERLVVSPSSASARKDKRSTKVFTLSTPKHPTYETQQINHSKLTLLKSRHPQQQYNNKEEQNSHAIQRIDEVTQTQEIETEQSSIEPSTSPSNEPNSTRVKATPTIRKKLTPSPIKKEIPPPLPVSILDPPDADISPIIERKKKEKSPTPSGEKQANDLTNETNQSPKTPDMISLIQRFRHAPPLSREQRKKIEIEKKMHKVEPVDFEKSWETSSDISMRSDDFSKEESEKEETLDQYNVDAKKQNGDLHSSEEENGGEQSDSDFDYENESESQSQSQDQDGFEHDFGDARQSKISNIDSLVLSESFDSDIQPFIEKRASPKLQRPPSSSSFTQSTHRQSPSGSTRSKTKSHSPKPNTSFDSDSDKQSDNDRNKNKNGDSRASSRNRNNSKSKNKGNHHESGKFSSDSEEDITSLIERWKKKIEGDEVSKLEKLERLDHEESDYISSVTKKLSKLQEINSLSEGEDENDEEDVELHILKKYGIQLKRTHATDQSKQSGVPFVNTIEESTTITTTKNPSNNTNNDNDNANNNTNNNSNNHARPTPAESKSPVVQFSSGFSDSDHEEEFSNDEVLMMLREREKKILAELSVLLKSGT